MRNVLLIVVCCVLLLSCRETVVDFGTLPYIEKIVVDGMITSGLPLQITFSKTMPPLTDVVSKQPYDTAAFRLTNVDATIISNAGDTATMRHVRMGLYVAIKSNGDTLYVQPGITYNLKASWNGLNVSATTTVPLLPTFDRTQNKHRNMRVSMYGDTSYYVSANVNLYGTIARNYIGISLSAFTKKNSMYTLYMATQDTLSSWVITDAIRRFDYVHDNPNAINTVRWYEYYEADTESQLDSLIQSENLYGIIHLYATPFYDYYKTRRSGSGSNGAFSSGGTNINWNINGDGIGLFCGRLIYIEKVVWKL